MSRWVQLVVFWLSVAAVAGLVGVLVYDAVKLSGPPVLSASIVSVTSTGEAQAVTVQVKNTGGRAAHDVVVAVEYQGRRTRSTVLYVPQGSTRPVVFLFPPGVGRGSLRAYVESYLPPP